MNFAIGDRVIHPKRPEWGVGTVQPPLKEDVFHVLFATAGPKTLRKDLVILHPWEEGKEQAFFKSETQHFRMKEVKPTQPNFFAREFEYACPPAYLKSFLKEELPREWFEKNKGLFDESDWQFIARTQRKKHHFHAWLGAVLLYRTLEQHSMQSSWVFQNQKEKQEKLQRCFSPEVLKEVKEHLAQHGIGSLPPLVCFDQVFHRVAMVWVKEAGEKFSPEQVAFTKKMVREHQVKFFLIRLSKKDKYDLTLAS